MLTEAEWNWSPKVKVMCVCGHHYLSHHLKEPHRCNGAWIHPGNRTHPDKVFTDCDCPGYRPVALA